MSLRPSWYLKICFFNTIFIYHGFKDMIHDKIHKRNRRHEKMCDFPQISRPIIKHYEHKYTFVIKQKILLTKKQMTSKLGTTKHNFFSPRVKQLKKLSMPMLSAVWDAILKWDKKCRPTRKSRQIIYNIVIHTHKYLCAYNACINII